jgi:hypothetical protein
MIAKTGLRIAKITWGVPIVLFGLAFTASCMVLTALSWLVCIVPVFLLRHYGWRVNNPAERMPEVFGWGLRNIFFRWACIRVFFENAAKAFLPGERVLIGANHGSLLSMLMTVWACAMFLPNPVRWAIKKELMEWWKIGPYLNLIGLAWDLDRQDGDTAVRKLETMGQGMERGSAAILIDGTRPTNRNIADGQKYYRSIGREDWAEKLLYSPPPRVRGFRTMHLNVPHERVVRVLVTSSTHEEGFWGLVDLMFSGAVFVRIEDWEEPLHSNDKDRFDIELHTIWIDRVQSWIGLKRTV